MDSESKPPANGLAGLDSTFEDALARGAELHRSEVKAMGLADAHLFPEQVRAELAQPKWKALWLSSFEARLRRAERDAVRLYAEIMKIVGQQVEFALNVWVQVGAKDESEAKMLITAAKRASNCDEDQLWARFLTFASDYCRRHPEARAEAMDSIGIRSAE